MKWTDTYEIAIKLEETFPHLNAETILFTELRKCIMSLEDFEDEPRNCNEKVLEAIQQAWLEERS